MDIYIHFYLYIAIYRRNSMTNRGVGRLQYSAGAVSKGFWFQELKKYNTLLNKGFGDGEIKEM